MTMNELCGNRGRRFLIFRILQSSKSLAREFEIELGYHKLYVFRLTTSVPIKDDEEKKNQLKCIMFS